jgi:hypothetical protein
MIKISLIGVKCPLLPYNAGPGIEKPLGAALLQDIKKDAAVDYLLRDMAGQLIPVILYQRIKGMNLSFYTSNL